MKHGSIQMLVTISSNEHSLNQSEFSRMLNKKIIICKKVAWNQQHAVHYFNFISDWTVVTFSCTLNVEITSALSFPVLQLLRSVTVITKQSPYIISEGFPNLFSLWLIFLSFFWGGVSCSVSYYQCIFQFLTHFVNSLICGIVVLAVSLQTQSVGLCLTVLLGKHISCSYLFSPFSSSHCALDTAIG
jgi:hypothetical protein